MSTPTMPIGSTVIEANKETIPAWVAEMQSHVANGGKLLFGNRPTDKVPYELSYKSNWTLVPNQSI